MAGVQQSEGRRHELFFIIDQKGIQLFRALRWNTRRRETKDVHVLILDCTNLHAFERVCVKIIDAQETETSSEPCFWKPKKAFKCDFWKTSHTDNVKHRMGHSQNVEHTSVC